jgi:cbb3-type cytochrome oxidase subunit 3
MRTIRGTAIAFVLCLLSYIAFSLRREFRQHRDEAKVGNSEPLAVTD